LALTIRWVPMMITTMAQLAWGVADRAADAQDADVGSVRPFTAVTHWLKR
jgi:hypothetical protein